jgi:mannose-6-phosphate isomerase-like protein (cupin superfamily)
VKVLAGGCRVYSPEDGQLSTLGNWAERKVISRANGAGRITQTVNDYGPGISPAVVNPNAEEVLYVASGVGVCRVGGLGLSLRRGCAVFVPPGATYTMENAGPETLRIVSTCCPEDSERRVVDRVMSSETSGELRKLMVHEDERKDIRAGEDRIFRYLVHTDLGCRQVTQFAGWIPPSKAPFHYHTYEEVIFILEGSGMVHVDEEACEFHPGSSIYFPAGVRHCVENSGDTTIKLLGAFYPSGSPGVAYEDQ